MNGFHISFQIDGTHWLVIFIHPNAVMESDDFIDVMQDQANSTPQ